MFDIIGFWFNVSLEVYVTVFIPLIFLGWFLVPIVVRQITQDEDKSFSADKWVRSNYNKEGIQTWNHENWFGGRFKIHEAFEVISVVSSGVFLVLFTIVHFCENDQNKTYDYTYVERLADVAIACAPFTSYIGAGVFTYIIFVLVGRKMYGLHLHIINTLKKLDEKVK